MTLSYNVILITKWYPFLDKYQLFIEANIILKPATIQLYLSLRHCGMIDICVVVALDQNGQCLTAFCTLSNVLYYFISRSKAN